MKSFLYKSKLIILIFSISACLLTLASAAIIKHNFTGHKDFSSLSDDYVVGEIKLLDYKGEKNITVNQLLNFVKSINANFIFVKKFSYGQGRGIVVSKDATFNLPLISGRLFKESDFENHTNTAIISEDIIDECVERDGKYYLLHDDSYYQVIGIFKGMIGSTEDEILYYINLQAELMQDHSIMGVYILDTKEESITDFEKIKQFITKLDDRITVQYAWGLSKESSKFSHIVSNSTKMIIIVLIGGGLVLINSLSATTFWITARKKEIGIRRLIGATDIQIYIWIIKQYIYLIISSYFVGALFATVIVKFSKKMTVIPTVYLLFGDKIDIQITILAFIILLIEGLFILFVALRYYTKNHIIQNVR